MNTLPLYPDEIVSIGPSDYATVKCHGQIKKKMLEPLTLESLFATTPRKGLYVGSVTFTEVFYTDSRIFFKADVLLVNLQDYVTITEKEKKVCVLWWLIDEPEVTSDSSFRPTNVSLPDTYRWYGNLMSIKGKKENICAV